MKIVNVDDVKIPMIDRWLLDEAVSTLAPFSQDEPLMIIARTDGGATKRYIFMEVPGIE